MKNLYFTDYKLNLNLTFKKKRKHESLKNK